MSAYAITAKQLGVEALKCAQVGLVPYVQGSPGVGKSSIFEQMAREHNLLLIDFRASYRQPEDIGGYPMREGNKATFVPFDLFPLEGDEIPAGYDGWLILCDELSSGSKPMQAALYQLILDRMVGSYRLHERAVVVAAGNKSTDKAVVNQMSTALQSRLIHYELKVDAREWLDWAYRSGVDHRVTAFIEWDVGALHQFNPDHHDRTFPCPRTWEFASKLIKGEELSHALMPRLAGTLSEGMAVKFVSFAENFEKIPSLKEILDDPLKARIPEEASAQYATASVLNEHADLDNLDDILLYVDRLKMELKIVFCRGVAARHKNLHYKHEGLKAFLMKMMRFLDA